MAERDVAALSGLVTSHEAELLAAWMGNQLEAGSLRSGQIKAEELQEQSRRFLRELTNALKSGEVEDVTGQAWNATRDLLSAEWKRNDKWQKSPCDRA